MKRTRKRRKKTTKAALLALYIAAAGLLLYHVHPLVHALGKREMTMEIGVEDGAVKARLSEKGVLTISGKGRTRDYTADTAPFLEYGDQITSVKIGEGVTGIGDYLFYNCGNLKGSLTLPSSVIWIGDEAFSGDSRETAPQFTSVISRFTEAEIARLKPGVEIPETTEAESETESPATPGEAESKPEETKESGTGETESTDSSENQSTEAVDPSVEPSTGAETEPTMPETTEAETPEPTVPKPTESGAAKPTETESGATKPTETELGETKPIEPEPGAAKPTEMVSGEAKSTDMEPGEAKPTKMVSGVAKPTDTRTYTAESAKTKTLTTESTDRDGRIFTIAGNRIPGPFSRFTLKDTENIVPETEETTETVEPDTEETTRTPSEVPAEKETVSKPVASPSTPQSTEADEEETEQTEEFSEDGMLSNNLYDGVIAASDVKDSERDYYTFETITSQLIGEAVFCSGQKGAYDCEPENTSFTDAAEQAGYRRADRFIQVELEGIRESLPVVNGVFYAPEVPEGLNGPEEDDPVFISCFAGWTLECDWESLGESAPVYETGSAVPVSEDEELVSLYGNWEKTCSFVPEVKTETRGNITVYSVVDANTEQPVPESGGYQFHYQWQICRPSAEESVADSDEAVTLENDLTGPGLAKETQENRTGPGIINGEETDTTGPGFPIEDELPAPESTIMTAHPENEESWEDIGEAVSAVYERQAEKTDAKSYFRVVMSVEKVSYFRSASQPVIMVSDPVTGKAETVKITVTLEAGGADGEAPLVEPVKDGLRLAPQANPFTRTDGQVFTGWLVSASGAEAVRRDGSSAVGTVILESEELTLSAAALETDPTITLTAQWSSDICTIFVDSAGGKDSNSGTSASEAVQTLSAAYGKLTKASMAQNRIVLCGTYSTGAITLGSKSATITGLNPENGSVGTFTLNGALYCSADTTFENMTFNTSQSREIYSNCHKLVMGYGLIMSNGGPYIYGGGSGNLTGNSDITICSGKYFGLGGSGRDSTISGNANITIIGGTVESNLHTGGSSSSTNGSKTYVSGNTNIHVYGCERMGGVLFGGARFGAVGGSTNIEIYGGEISQIVGGPHSGSLATVRGKINVAIHGGTIGSVFGGGYDANGSNASVSPCSNGVNILMDGGVISGDFFCGSFGYYGSPKYFSIKGGVNAELTGGKIEGNFYGGSDLDKMQGNVNIRLAGVEIAGDVFAGGVGRAAYNTSTVYSAYTEGNITMDIESGTVVKGNIYGGAKDYGSVYGNVTINYSGSLPDAGGSLYGGGYGINTTVNGTSTVTVNPGAFIADSLYGCGEKGKVSNGSTVILNGGTIGNKVFAAGNDVGATTTSLVVNGTTAVGDGIYGGSNHSETTGTAGITINSPIETEVYGGGFGGGTTVTNTAITIASGGNVKKSVFGGGNLGKVTNSEITVNGTAADVFGGGNSAGVSGTTKVTVNEGAEAGNIYGGSNAKETTAKPQITIAGKVTGSVYGGGLGPNTTVTAPVVTLSGKGEVAGSLFGGGNAGIVTGGTTLNITGGHAGLIFGGGDAREVTGGTTVSMTGGTAGSVYGGGNSAGVDGTVTINLGSGAGADNIYGGSNSQGTVVSPKITIEGTAGNVYASGQGSGTITKSPTVTLEKTAAVTNLYGGGMEGDTQDGTTLVLKNENTPVQNVYGGGNQAGVTGTVSITQDANARAARIFGGSNSSGTVTASVLTINGQVGTEAAGAGTAAAGTEDSGTTEEAQPTGALYGAGFGEGTITEATSVTVGTTAVVHGDVFGGGDKGLVSGDTSVLINSSSQLTGNIYGGGNEAAVSGSTHLQADKDSVVAGSVYGGGKGEKAVVTNTRVIVSAHVTGNVFGGGAKGPVKGSTHVDIPQGLIDGEGNVFGGSDQALVSENTQVHIGKEAADGNHIDITEDTSLLIHGTVFGGGNTTADGNSFDATNPFVGGTSEVSVTATGYGAGKFNIMTSIFGDGNKCVVAGSRTVILTDYQALGNMANASIQRADTLTLNNSQVELTGAIDSANLVPTIAYSLNRIDDLRLVGGSVLKIQSPVNLVRSYKSLYKNGDGTLMPVPTTSTTVTGVKPGTENKIYIQQGTQMELRTSEDITTTQYGTVSGYSLLFAYDVNGEEIQSGVYVLGGYGEAAAGGFLYGEAGEDQYKMIDPRTDGQNWQNWALGTDMTKSEILVMSNKPAGRKIVQIESPWGADGSVYRPIEDTDTEHAVEIESSDGSIYTLQNPASMDTADSPDTTLGLSVRTGSQGWMNQTEAGYLVGSSDDVASCTVADKQTMRTLNNQSIKPIIEIELTNRLAITADDAAETYPLIVRLKLDNINVKSDGSEVNLGKLTIEMKIRRESAQTYEDILLAPGKEYVRGTQTYVFGGDKATAGGAGMTISKQSAITVQYTKKDETQTKGPRSFRMKFYANATLDSMGEEVTLPEGVTIQAIDRTTEYPEYAHYKVPASGAKAVSLTDFTKNGTNESYARTFDHTAPINYLFIIDFQNTPSFSQEKLCVAIEPVYDDGSVGTAGKAVFNVTSDPKVYGMSNSAATGAGDEGEYYERKSVIPSTLKVWARGENAVDTTGKNQEMGVCLKLKNRDTGIYIPIPTNWYAKNEETLYTVSGNDIIVPLSSGMAEMSTSMEIGMDESSLSAGKYQWELHLISSPLAEYPGELKDTPQYINFNLTDKRYSIAAGYQDQTTNRLYPANQETAREPLHLQAKLQATGGAATDGVRLKVSLLKKEADTKIYSTVNLDTLFTDVTGIGQYYDWAASQEITFALKQTLPAGTYRLRFELVQNQNGTKQVVAYDTENFIVTP